MARRKNTVDSGQLTLFDSESEPAAISNTVHPAQVLVVVWGNEVEVPASELNGATRKPMQEASAVWRGAKHLSGKIPSISLAVHNFKTATGAINRVSCMSSAKKTILLVVDLERRADTTGGLLQLEELWSRRTELSAPVFLPIVFGRNPNWASESRNRELQLVLKRFGEVEFVSKAMDSRRAFWVASSKIRQFALVAARSLEECA